MTLGTNLAKVTALLSQSKLSSHQCKWFPKSKSNNLQTGRPECRKKFI